MTTKSALENSELQSIHLSGTWGNSRLFTLAQAAQYAICTPRYLQNQIRAGRLKALKPDGFKYRQIARQGNVAIYEQTWLGCGESSVCYEVIRIRRHDGFQIGGRSIEPAEFYPKSEAWGVDGFTLTDKDAAFAKMREVSR